MEVFLEAEAGLERRGDRKLEEERRGGQDKDPVFTYRDVLEWGGAGFVCFLIPRITETLRHFGKLKFGNSWIWDGGSL